MICGYEYGCICAMVSMWRQEENFVRARLFFHLYLGSHYQTGLQSKCLIPQAILQSFCFKMFDDKGLSKCLIFIFPSHY